MAEALDLRRDCLINQHHQLQSPLFDQIPPEIRFRIFSFALTDYEDLHDAYSLETCYRRPGYFGPRRTSTALLHTCKRVYQEAWFMPWANARHTFYLATDGRKPPRHTTVEKMQRELNHMHHSGLEVDVRDVQVFSQLCELEWGRELEKVLSMVHFRPRTITVTVRHTDCWWWENDARLQFDAEWVTFCRFPTSVRELYVEVESLVRKKEQVDIIAQGISQWQFRDTEGKALVANAEKITTQEWTGSSTWQSYRWIRDETQPNEIEYYIATVLFQPSDATRDKKFANEKVEVPDGKFEALVPNQAYVRTWELEQANIPYGVPGDEVLELLRQHRQKATRPSSGLSILRSIREFRRR